MPFISDEHYNFETEVSLNVVVAKSTLLSFLAKIQNVVPLKPTLPILANLLIEAVDDQLVLSATDLTVSMRCQMEAKVIEEGSIALPARRFAQLMREITTQQIKIQVHAGESAEIIAGTSLFRIHGMEKLEFPPFPDLGSALKLSIENNSLKEMLSKTAFAAAKEDSRYTLNGLHLLMTPTRATFTGTDGKRLARAVTPISLEIATHTSYVIPLKAIEEMGKIIEEGPSHSTLSFSQDKISLESGSVTLVAKLLAGHYPDVDRVIPVKSLYQFPVHREELMSLLKQVSLFTSEASTAVRFTFETGQLHLTAMSSEIGEGRVSMPVDFPGPKLDIAFNPFYLLDILRHSKEETVLFRLNDPHSPGLITDSSQALFVLMPMRLGDTAPSPQEIASAV